MLNHSKCLKLFSVILSVLMIVSLFTTPSVFEAEAALCGGNLSGNHRNMAARNGLLSKKAPCDRTELKRYSI